jgi:competence protein ComGF
VASKSVRRGNDEARGKEKMVIKIKNRKCESHWTEGITTKIKSMEKNILEDI